MGWPEEILSLVLAYERIKGEASRYFGTPLFEQGAGVRAVNAELRDSYESFYEGYVKQLLNTRAPTCQRRYTMCLEQTKATGTKILLLKPANSLRHLGL